ncbi:hypothetical protein SO802_026479 [Lithocarpus litseifolius]|uniref:Uncharacterized protein n=1 Tax=Lithocarpus litseifolius TaxID=425828 RepID=A0AAW2BZV2_9ROSI
MENNVSPQSTTSTTTTISAELYRRRRVPPPSAMPFRPRVPPLTPPFRPRVPPPPSTTMSPSTCSSSIDNTVSSTQNRLYQARLILQYQELNDHYDLCRARLINLLSEAESLRHENVELCLPNAELLKLLSSQALFHNLLLSSLYPTEAILKKNFFFVFSFFREIFELEMIFLCICCTVWLPRK